MYMYGISESSMRVQMEHKLLLTLALLACVCAWKVDKQGFGAQADANAGVNAAVAHGYRAAKGRYPWFCTFEVLFPDGTWKPMCGGVLIAPDVVLTAAHCPIYFNTFARASQRIAIGRYDMRTDEGVEFRMISHSVTPQKNIDTNKGDLNQLQNLKQDVALLFLDKPSSAPTVKIANDRYMPPTKNWKIIGFGGIDAKLTKPNTLQEAVVRRFKCTEETNRRNRNICVVNLKTQAGGCPGDSGGPLFVDVPGQPIMVLGVTSGADSSTSCGDGKMGAWTDLRLHVPWIRNAMANRASRNSPA